MTCLPSTPWISTEPTTQEMESALLEYSTRPSTSSKLYKLIWYPTVVRQNVFLLLSQLAIKNNTKINWNKYFSLLLGPQQIRTDMTDRKRDNPALMPIKILLVVHPSQVVKNLKSAMVPTMVMAKHNKVHMEDTVRCNKKETTQMINYLNFSAEKRMMIDWL